MQTFRRITKCREIHANLKVPFLRVYEPRRNKHVKKERGQYPAFSDRPSLVNSRFILW